jgi:hypothetical protein
VNSRNVSGGIPFANRIDSAAFLVVFIDFRRQFRNQTLPFSIGSGGQIEVKAARYVFLSAQNRISQSRI